MSFNARLKKGGIMQAIKKHFLLLVILLISFLSLTFSVKSVFADDCLTKAGRGIANVATGWLEVPKEVAKQTEKAGDIAGFFVAPIKGIAKGLGRTLAGVYDVVTFLIPIPHDYEPLIEPEFVFKSQD